MLAYQGLRQFGFEDAPLFARLQRDAPVRECVEGLTDPEFRFGILSLAEHLHLPPASVERAEWLPLLAMAAQTTSKPLVVLLDQFEQFFIHHKRKKYREPFVHALVAWYRQEPPLPVKILVCIQ
jgi:hypothetical protein